MRWLTLLLAMPLLVTGLTASDTPVADAAREGDIETVRLLLREGADVNAAHGDGMTALHWAARRGDVELGEILVYAGASVDAGTRIGRYTPLHIAARNGHVGIVTSLLAARGNPNAATANSGATPLHLAAASGRPEVVSVLLKAGADVNATESSWGQTPLMFAAGAGRVEAIRALLEAGADPSITSQVVDTTEMERADRAANRQLMELIAGFKAKEGGGPNWQPTPSQVQAAIEAARQIQRKWPDVPQQGGGSSKGPAEAQTKQEGQPKPEGATVRFNADGQPVGGEDASSQPEARPKKAAGAVEAVTFDPDGQPVHEVDPAETTKPDAKPRPLTYGQLVGSWGGLTPLLHAVRQGHTDAALALLDGGANINQPSAGDQTTPLLMAAVNGQFDLALLLIERGADPNAASDAQTTPLFAVLERTWAPRASYSHPTEHQQQDATHLDVMRALLEAGSDPDVRLKRHIWFTEYTFAVLRQSGVNLAGATPFWRAALALDVDAMRLLREYGADPNIPTIKPPERRRRRPPPSQDPQPDADEAKQEAAEKPVGDKKADKPKKAAAEGESSEPESQPAEEKKDHSGVPPVPVGGPAIYPIHAASGVGYGKAFAGNAHRHVPDNWLAAVKFLVQECGADLNLRDADAFTALHNAAARGDNELILYLVEKGADVSVVSRKGQTTADMANGPIQRVSPFPSTIALLEKLGSKNNHKCVSC